VTFKETSLMITPIHLRALCLAALVGCGGHTLDIGSTDGGTESTDPRQAPVVGGSGSPIWNGTLENAQLANGSNRLTMTLAVASDGTATGSVLLGDGTLLQPPTDPDVGYPPGVQFTMIGPLGFFEGFRYTMLDGRSSGSRLTFKLAEFELWSQWCALQRPYCFAVAPDGGRTYSCFPYSGNTGCPMIEPATTGEMPNDLGKEELCGPGSPCNCSATTCRESSSLAPDITFDLTIAGSTADGTISGELGDHDVHFVRAP